MKFKIVSKFKISVLLGNLKFSFFSVNSGLKIPYAFNLTIFRDHLNTF
jgi:hypothetical protein